MMPARKRPPLRVIVADDSTVFRAALKRLLAVFPEIQVIAEAANGQEVLQVVEAMAPDLLILDIQMPEINGLEVLQHLQGMETGAKVVVLSGHGDRYQDQVLASGATAYVPKGDIPQLLNTLSHLLKDTVAASESH